MSRLRCLHDFGIAGVDALVECNGCGRRVRADPNKLHAGLKVKWRRSLAYEGSKLKCSVCGHKGGRIAPIPRIVSPLDCDEFRADVDCMWERVMAEELAGQCNAEIAPPDGDGLVYVLSRSEDSRVMACLGTKQEAAEIMSQWLSDHEEGENA